jgi:hypothetical protein
MLGQSSQGSCRRFAIRAWELDAVNAALGRSSGLPWQTLEGGWTAACTRDTQFQSLEHLHQRRSACRRQALAGSEGLSLSFMR